MIDWKLRLRNKTFLLTLVMAIVAFVYQMLGMFGIVAPISEDMAGQIIGIIVNLLAGLGIVINPTTDGVSD